MVSLRCLGNVGSSLAIALATPLVMAASVVPSIEITSLVSSSCTSAGADTEVTLNTPDTTPHSDNYEIYNGSTLIFRWTGEIYSGVGPNFHYGITNGPAVAADTKLTGVIYTFPESSNPSPPYTPDKYSYRSQIDFNCTTGEVFDIINSVGGSVTAQPVPVLGTGVLTTLAVLLALSAIALLRVSTPRRG